MELKELFEMQRKLDEHIIKEKGLEGQDLMNNKILALHVELGELANETRCFKHWSNKGPSPKERILEEYADCLHFILSIGLSLGMDWRLQDGYNANIYSTNITKQFNGIFEYITELEAYLGVNLIEVIYLHLVENFLGLGTLLGFTEEIIVQAYKDKNKVNHARQENGY